MSRLYSLPPLTLKSVDLTIQAWPADSLFFSHYPGIEMSETERSLVMSAYWQDESLGGVGNANGIYDAGHFSLVGVLKVSFKPSFPR